ncbi:uncharacterized protein LOC122289343 [Carya illinoinensis]|uniref:uncharacterized protein LOC122289343 n=1 Tax=Carya illinoinensis TaxID=32201 RepID=UPI001C719504|nr:uncharacterized protein LOC122289343 [Carya illinoinensis]
MVDDTSDNFKIAPEKLTGRTTYDSWARIARMSIASKKKLGYITGTKKAPEKTNAEAYETWEEKNCTVQTWLLNSMEKHVRVLFDSLPTAATIWCAVEKTYIVTNNSSRVYELTQRSVNIKQEGRTLEVYYEELQTIWLELDAINPPQIKNEIDLCTHLATVINFHVYILLAGLDSHLDGARAHVLRSDSLPNVLEAYAMICEEDTCLKTMGSEEKTSGSALAARKGKEGSLYESPKLFSKSSGSNLAKDERKCSHCGKNHIVDKCWKLHGRADWADELIAIKQGSRASLATTSTIENADEAKSGNFDYALCTPTSSCNNAWIIDTGATDHMTNNPKKFITLTKNYSKYYVRTATGQIISVTRIGTIQLIPNIMLLNVLLDLHTQEEMGRGFKRGDLWYFHHGSKLNILANQTSKHFSATIKVMRSENGGEYLTNNLAIFFQLQGIVHQTSCANTPLQNGVAERRNRQLLEVTRAFLFEKNVPKYLWGDALQFAIKDTVVITHLLKICGLLWVKTVTKGLGFLPIGAMPLYCDNKSTIAIAQNPVQHDRTKHVDIDRHFIKEKLEAHIIEVPFLKSED